MFAPPYDWPTIVARQTEGNLALLVLVDSRRVRAYEEARQAIFPALIHMGLPYRVRDAASGALGLEEMRAYQGVVLVQEGLALSDEEQGALLGALDEGIGLVSFDPCLPVHAPLLASGLGLSGGDSERFCAAVRAADNSHFVSNTRVVGESLSLIRPVPLRPAGGVWRPTLVSDDGSPALALGQRGSGRWAHFCLSPKVWLNNYLGHANGLDGPFWRVIVWVARKPFVMKAMPPFVTARIDDAQGVGSFWWNIQRRAMHSEKPLPDALARLICDIVPARRSSAFGFQYLDVFAKHGVIPAVGIYIEQLSGEDRLTLKRHFDAGTAEFSIHALSDHNDYDLGRINCFLYQRGWPDGTVALAVDEYSAQELAHNFQRADRFWGESAMRSSRVLNTHYVNPGLNSLPFLKARGQDMVMSGGLFGKTYESHYLDPWSRAPYGSVGMILDYMPVPEGSPGVRHGDFFNVEAHAYDVSRLAATGRVDDGDIDFAMWTTMTDSRRDSNDLQGAVDAAVRQVSIGLDGLFFGCMMAHEQGLAALTVGELEDILGAAESTLSRFDMLPAPYEHVGEYARCHVDTRLEVAREEGAGITCRLSGRSTLPLKLYVWQDVGEGCGYSFREAPPFSGGCSVAL